MRFRARTQPVFGRWASLFVRTVRRMCTNICVEWLGSMAETTKSKVVRRGRYGEARALAEGLHPPMRPMAERLHFSMPARNACFFGCFVRYTVNLSCPSQIERAY